MLGGKMVGGKMVGDKMVGGKTLGGKMLRYLTYVMWFINLIIIDFYSFFSLNTNCKHCNWEFNWGSLCYCLTSARGKESQGKESQGKESRGKELYGFIYYTSTAEYIKDLLKSNC